MAENQTVYGVFDSDDSSLVALFTTLEDAEKCIEQHCFKLAYRVEVVLYGSYKSYADVKSSMELAQTLSGLSPYQIELLRDHFSNQQ